MKNAFSKNAFSSSNLVYSTESGRICPDCRQPVIQCNCKSATATPLGDGNIRVSRETKGRAGKGVTVIRGLPLATAELAALGKQLRTACGSGGTVKDGTLEIQGDHADRVVELLKAQGLSVKRAGG